MCSFVGILIAYFLAVGSRYGTLDYDVLILTLQAYES